MIIRMYPPFPIPGFAPNFTGYDWDNLNMDWNEVYKYMAQAPRTTVNWVSFNQWPVTYFPNLE